MNFNLESEKKLKLVDTTDDIVLELYLSVNLNQNTLQSILIYVTFCLRWRILIRYCLLSDIYQIPKLCIRLQVTMGCCKFIFVYTTRTIITVSPEINIIFKKDASRVIFPNDTLKRYTLFLSGFSQDLFLFLKGVSYFTVNIHIILKSSINSP